MLLKAVRKYTQKPDPLGETDEQVLLKRLFQIEVVLMQVLEFCFRPQHPYATVKSIIKAMFDRKGKSNPITDFAMKESDKGIERKLSHKAMEFVNDSLSSSLLCLRFEPEKVALASIDLAVKLLNKHREDRPIILKAEWFELFYPGLTSEELAETSLRLLESVEQTHQEEKGTRQKRSRTSKDEDARRPSNHRHYQS